MTARAEFPFFHPFRVRYNETDQQAVVFFGNYMIYYDHSISECLRWLGHDYKNQVRDTGTDFHIVKSTVEYRSPLRYDDELFVGVRIARLGNSSITWETAIYVGDAEEPSSVGEIIWANADQTAGTSAPVPDELRKLIGAKMAELAPA